MTDTEIISGNKVIAEFMGNYPRIEKYKTATHNIEVGVPDEKLQYHSSWDWQIPAWAKLVHLCQEIVSKTNGDEHKPLKDSYYYFLDNYENSVSNNNPLQGFEIIIRTLKWYKTQIK